MRRLLLLILQAFSVLEGKYKFSGIKDALILICTLFIDFHLKKYFTKSGICTRNTEVTCTIRVLPILNKAGVATHLIHLSP